MKIKLILTIFFAITISFAVTRDDTFANEMTEYDKYALAVECYENGQYQDSFDLLEQMQGYSTSKSYYDECKRLLTPIIMPNNDAYYKISSALYELGISHAIPLLTYQVEQITVLDLSGCEIDDLSFISRFVNLEELHLDNNKLTDIMPLKDLYKLHTLSASGNEISDITPLYNLTNLNYLNLSNNNIEDIDYLANLTNLLELDLSSNNIEGIWVVKEMPNLTKLDLSNNKIKYLRALSEADSIKELNLMVNEFESVAALSTMTNLEVLELGEYWYSYHDEEEGLEELISHYTVQTEYIYRQKKVFIDGAFDGLTNLRKLSLVNVGIVSIDFLRDFEHLEELNLDYSKIYGKQESLENINNLKYLSLKDTLFNAQTYQPSGNCVDDISIIADMTSLEHLNICGTPLKDLSRLGELTNLTYLDISGSKISDVEFLSSLQRLTHLLLGNCQYVVDFSPLKNLNNIEYLDLSYANLKYFDYISHMHGLKYLNLMDALFNSIDGIENMEDLEYLNIRQWTCCVEERIEIANCIPFNSIEEQEDFINMYHIDSDLILNLKNLVHYTSSEINAGIPLDFKNLEYLKPTCAADGIPVNIKEVKVGSNSSEIQKDMDYISYFSNLERLDLEVGVGKDCIIKIPYFENLRILNIGIGLEHWWNPEDYPYVPIVTVDFSSLKGQSNLEYINIGCGRGDYDYREKYIDIKSLSGLEGCENLRVIIIDDATLSDISALENCENLEIVEFSNCNIKDISALADKYYLKELNLMKNNITDISVLKNCYRMNRLRLSSNPITDADVIMEMPLLADVWLDDTSYKRSSELSSYMKKMFTRWNH